MFRTICLMFLIAGCVQADEMNADTVDAATRERVFKHLQKQYPGWANYGENVMDVKPYWKGVLRVRVVWGQERDPMPDPFICYAAFGGKVLGDLPRILERLKYVPADSTEALEAAGRLVQSEYPHDLIVILEPDLDRLPAEFVREHQVALPVLARDRKGGFTVALYSYQFPRRPSFSSLFREETLRLNRVVMRGGKISVETRTLFDGSLLEKRPQKER